MGTDIYVDEKSGVLHFGEERLDQVGTVDRHCN